MNDGLVYRTRVALINMGKMLPFFVCVVVFVSYAESTFALATSDFIATDDAIILNKHLSWLIAEYFRYNIVSVLVMAILSYSINACVWNKLALLYLLVQLYEKEYFITVELESTTIYIVCIINMTICAYLIYKGTKNTLFTRKC